MSHKYTTIFEKQKVRKEKYPFLTQITNYSR